jgi:hypothetical protein
LISSFTLLQTFIYPRGPEQYLSKRFQSLLVTLLAVIATTFVGALTRWLSMLDFIYFLSYIKLFASFIKYLVSEAPGIRLRLTISYSHSSFSISAGSQRSVGVSPTSFSTSPAAPSASCSSSSTRSPRLIDHGTASRAIYPNSALGHSALPSMWLLSCSTSSFMALRSRTRLKGAC